MTVNTRRRIFKSYTNLDFDRDGVVNVNDCRPLNPLMQHIKPNKEIEAELKGLGKYKGKSLKIYIKTSNGTFHLMSKEAKRYAPNTVKEIYKIIKKYPNVLKMLRHSGDTLTYVINEIGEGSHSSFHKSYVYIQPEYSYLGRWNEIRKRRNVFRRHPLTKKKTPIIQQWETQDAKNKILDSDSISIKANKRTDRMAKSAFHELHHGIQEKKYGKDKFENKYLRDKVVYLSGKFRHRKRRYWFPFDLNAQWHARRHIEERKKKGEHLPPESFSVYD